MKINWGTGIVIAIALFVSFILYFVLLVGVGGCCGRRLNCVAGNCRLQQRSKFLRRSVSQTAVRPFLVVLDAPRRDFLSCIE